MEASIKNKFNQYINHTYRLMLSLMQCSDNVVTSIYFRFKRIGIIAKQQ